MYFDNFLNHCQTSFRRTLYLVHFQMFRLNQNVFNRNLKKKNCVKRMPTLTSGERR